MASKSERLLQLLLLLQQPRTRGQLRRNIPDYAATANEESFARMFERDKAELRDLGLPMTVDRPDAADENLAVYRIPLAEHQLPPLHLTPEEAAAVAVAASLWEATESAQVARLAAVKVAADDVAPVNAATGMTALRPAAGFEHIPALTAALQSRQAVRFDYRGAGEGTVATRTVQPWRLTASGRAWYLTGFDLDRAAQRQFRLSRLLDAPRPIGPANAYEVPEGIDEPTPDPAVTARLRLAPGTAWPLRRRGRAVADDLVDVDFGDLDGFARELVGHGADVVVLSPPALRAAVVDRLTGLAAS